MCSKLHVLAALMLAGLLFAPACATDRIDDHQSAITVDEECPDDDCDPPPDTGGDGGGGGGGGGDPGPVGGGGGGLTCSQRCEADYQLDALVCDVGSAEARAACLSSAADRFFQCIAGC